MPKSSTASPTDLTLDAVPASAVEERCRRIALIEGTGPQITVETAHLLRDRLRAAAMVLLAGFGAFFVWRLFAERKIDGGVALLFWLHLSIVVLEGLSVVLLHRRCAIPLRVLRIYEVAIFFPPALLFAVFHYEHLKYWAQRGFVPSPTGVWFLLMFTYALFIPNTWKRAAIVLTAMAATPVLLVAWLQFTDPVFANALELNPDFVGELVLALLIGLASSTYGTYTINVLRREAFEARQFGQYRLHRMLGAGGMGEVYLAEHQLMKRPCAIKLIRPGKANDPQALARFEREVRATAKLSHWNSIEIFDYGRTEDGTFYYVMEYLPGLSLAEMVERHGPLPASRAIHLLMQTCDALAEAHALGLMHRDIKPGNLFVAQRGGVYDVSKLLDFGLAKPILPSGSAQLTQEGMVTGSPLYMSPEQATGDLEPDARSDIYSLGAVGYYMLTGSPPFPGENAVKIILAHASQLPTPPTRLRPDIPADLERVILRCLAKEREARYGSALELSAALAACAAAGKWNRDCATDWWKANGIDDLEASALVAATI